MLIGYAGVLVGGVDIFVQKGFGSEAEQLGASGIGGGAYLLAYYFTYLRRHSPGAG